MLKGFFFNFSGFIDYIVLPTLSVLGDALDLILSAMDGGNKTTSVPENEVTSNGSLKDKKPLLRPWTDILGVNRERWQKKHDSGKQLARGYKN